MRVLVTGANGFVAKNLISFLKEKKDIEILTCFKETSEEELSMLVSKADFVYHLAGVNRPKEISEFALVNTGLTEKICELIKDTGRKIPVVFSSSTQAELDNDYGKSKIGAEKALLGLARETNAPIYIFRMPNVFGKWCRPNYNSVVATFCYNISHGLPIQVNNKNTELTLVYVDDLVEKFASLIEVSRPENNYPEVEPQYKITLGELTDLLYSFQESRKNLITEKVGTGLTRALYSTFVSYLEPEHFQYKVPGYADDRGIFVEMLKTKDSGQFSFFTAHPGVTRGSHYHHTKTEKFLVIKGKAKFGFRHILTDKRHTIYTSGETPEIVETIPGWTHDITNIGEDEMIVMLWANEIFDRSKPDTFYQKV